MEHFHYCRNCGIQIIGSSSNGLCFSCENLKRQKKDLEEKKYIPPFCNCGYEFGYHKGWCNAINTK